MRDKRRAETDPTAWLADAEKKLARADAQFKSRDYGDAVSDLQGAEERIAKAIMLALGMLSQDETLAAKMDIAFPGIKYKEPKHLMHNWHERMFEDFGPFLDTMEWTGKQFKGKPGGESTAAFWQSAISDYRQKLKEAKTIKANPKPTLQELDAILADCNRLVRGLDETLNGISVPSVGAPSQDLIDSLVTSFLKRSGVSMPKSERLAAEESELAKFKPFLANFESKFKRILEPVYLLVVLAILNVYLYQHHTMGSYPSSQYTESFPMVVRFGEVSSLIRTVLERAKKALPEQD